MNNRTARKLDALDRRLDAIAARTRLEALTIRDQLHGLGGDMDVHRTELLDQRDWLSRHADLIADHGPHLAEIFDRLEDLEGAATPLCAPESVADGEKVPPTPGNGTGENRTQFHAHQLFDQWSLDGHLTHSDIHWLFVQVLTVEPGRAA